MLGGWDRQPLHAAVKGGPLGNGPGGHHSADLQPEIIMQRARLMFLHHKDERVALCLVFHSSLPPERMMLSMRRMHKAVLYEKTHSSFSGWARALSCFCNSLRASLAIHLAAGESSCLIAEAHSTATARRWLLRFPIWRKAQFTAFFTKLRSSPAYCLINGKKGKNASSLARLS